MLVLGLNFDVGEWHDGFTEYQEPNAERHSLFGVAEDATVRPILFSCLAMANRVAKVTHATTRIDVTVALSHVEEERGLHVDIGVVIKG